LHTKYNFFIYKDERIHLNIKTNLAIFSFPNMFLNFHCTKLNMLKIYSISADIEQVINKIINTFISSLLTVLFRCLHAFHHSKADKYKVVSRGSLEDRSAQPVGHN